VVQVQRARAQATSVAAVAEAVVSCCRSRACARAQAAVNWVGSLNLWLKFAAELEDHASITTASANTYIGGFGRIQQVTVTEVRTVTAGESVQALMSHNRGAITSFNLTHAVVQQLA
jgi:hypothetical protein